MHDNDEAARDTDAESAADDVFQIDNEIEDVHSLGVNTNIEEIVDEKD